MTTEREAMLKSMSEPAKAPTCGEAGRCRCEHQRIGKCARCNESLTVAHLQFHANEIAMETAIKDIENGSLGNALSVLRFALAKSGVLNEKA